MENHFPLYDETLRFHVRASSDESLEQDLKLAVRDAILRQIRPQADRAVSARDLERQLLDCRQEIAGAAMDCLRELGYKRDISVYFSKERFPLRSYGAIIFPAGDYLALRVDIGEGKGHNWWCALYPELCYNSEEYVLTGKGKQDLKGILFGQDRGRPVKKVARGLGDQSLGMADAAGKSAAAFAPDIIE